MNQAEISHTWFAVINVYAASQKASKAWERAELRMKDISMPFHGARTGKAGNAMEITFDACMSGYRKFLAVGGDGTVHDVLNGIAAYIEWKDADGRDSSSFSDFTLGVIPVGSGNDWIRSTGVPKDINQAVDTMKACITKKQDVVKVSMLDENSAVAAVSYMANIGGVGLDAKVCKMVNAKKRQGKRGRILYVTSLLSAISRRKPARARVICDGKTIFDGSYLSMAFGIGKYSGGGMRQTPEAVLDDNLLDVTIIPDIKLNRIACEIPRLFTGTFLKVPELISSRGREIVVHTGHEEFDDLVEVDGEIVGKTPVRFEIMGSQINIVVKEQIMTDQHR